MQDASNRLQALAGQQPTGLAETMRHELAVAAANFEFRQAARQEQLRLYELAGYASVESSVVPLLPGDRQAPFEYTISALHSL